jgi:hypothetical protein
LAVTFFGTTVHGEVTGKADERMRGSTVFRVQYRFVMDERDHAAEGSVSEAAFANLSVGNPVKVRVLPGWPGSPRLQEPAGRDGGSPLCLLSFAVPAGVALVVLMRFGLCRPLRQRALVRYGIATVGWIVAGEGGGSAPWRVHYGYRAPRHGLTAGAEGQGNGESAQSQKEWQVRMTVRREDYEAAQAGMTVIVLFDPHRPAHSVVYPFADYEAAAS